MKYLKNRFVQFALIVIVAELFLFNFRTFESLFFPKAESFDVAYSEGAVVADTVSEGYEKSIAFPETGDCYIEIPSLNQKISNLFIDAASTENLNDKVAIQLSARDDGNEIYYELPEVALDPKDASSQYLKLNLSGKAKSLKITFLEGNGKTFYFDTPKLNVTRPLMISFVRMILLYLALCILYWLRPSSSIYQTGYSLKSKSQRIVLIFMAGLQLLLFSFLATSNESYVHTPWHHHDQYPMLAEALSEGHFYLNEKPGDDLIALSNPYDRKLREQEHVFYIFDTAYYEGEYYVYFGVVPVLTFYLPYYLVTGNAFPTWIGIIISGAVLIIGLFFLLHALFKKYFKSSSFGLFILMNILLYLGSGILITGMNATFYQLPITMTMAFTVWGLYLWITSVKEHGFSIPRIVAGSLCMALVAGCRPQMLLGSFLALPLLMPTFISRIKDQKQRKSSVITFVLALLPYMIVGACLMYYNAARFGSPFDFGANYNLTTNDMTLRGFKLDRTPLGIYMYLFQPPTFATSFPFIQNVTTNIQYQGITIFEKTYGGILWLTPLLFTVFLYHKVKDVLKEKKLQIVTLLLFLFSFVIVLADTQMAGILFRYMCDFGLFLSLAAAFIILSFSEKVTDGTVKRLWYKALYVGTALAGIIWFLIIRFVIG